MLTLASCVARGGGQADRRAGPSSPAPAVASPEAAVAAAPSPAAKTSPPKVEAAPVAAGSSTAGGADGFATNVRPILARTCAPCHNPGGIMYGKLPFDDPDVIRGHSEGVLRRLKGADRDAVAAWLAAAGSSGR